jgi:hypothetical protein
MHFFPKKKKIYHEITRYIDPIRDIKILLLTIAVIMIWKGIWDILDTYFPTDSILASIVSILIGVLILFLNDNDLSQLAEVEKKHHKE